MSQRESLSLQIFSLQLNHLIRIDATLTNIQRSIDLRVQAILIKLDAVGRIFEINIGRLALLMVRSPITEGMATFAEKDSRRQTTIREIIEGITKTFKIKIPIDELKELYTPADQQQVPPAQKEMTKLFKTAKQEIMSTLGSMLKSMLILQPLTRAIGAFLEPLEPLADTAESIGSILSQVIVPGANELNSGFQRLLDPLGSVIEKTRGVTDAFAPITSAFTFAIHAFDNFKLTDPLGGLFDWLIDGIKEGIKQIKATVSELFATFPTPTGGPVTPGTSPIYTNPTGEGWWH